MKKHGNKTWEKKLQMSFEEIFGHLSVLAEEAARPRNEKSFGHREPRPC